MANFQGRSRMPWISPGNSRSAISGLTHFVSYKMIRKIGKGRRSWWRMFSAPHIAQSLLVVRAARKTDFSRLVVTDSALRHKSGRIHLSTYVNSSTTFETMWSKKSWTSVVGFYRNAFCPVGLYTSQRTKYIGSVDTVFDVRLSLRW